jgi:hypothetical protein
MILFEIRNPFNNLNSINEILRLHFPFEFRNINSHIKILIRFFIPSSLMLWRRIVTSIMVWSAIERISILIIIAKGTNSSVILIIIVVVVVISILISFKTLLELLDLPFYFIHFKNMDVPLEVLHVTSINNHNCKF